MDYGLAHYYNREERDMNFLQSMTTANFWSNDFYPVLLLPLEPCYRQPYIPALD